MTSGYSPIGAMIASDRLFEPFRTGTTSFPHGYTFGGHPVSAAVAMANLDIFEREGLNEHVHDNAPAFRATLEKLLDLPIVGDVRGDGLLLRHRAGQGQGDQGDLRRRRVRAPAARVPLQGAVRRRPVLPRRRPRRPGHPARPAADRRPARVRRDRADAARRPHRGREAPLTANLAVLRCRAARFAGGSVAAQHGGEGVQHAGVLDRPGDVGTSPVGDLPHGPAQDLPGPRLGQRRHDVHLAAAPPPAPTSSRTRPTSSACSSARGSTSAPALSTTKPARHLALELVGARRSPRTRRRRGARRAPPPSTRSTAGARRR